VGVGVTGVGVRVELAVGDGVAVDLGVGEAVADGAGDSIAADGKAVALVATTVAVTKRTAPVDVGATETSPQLVVSRATISTIALTFEK
jgi:hypothetical protein